MSDPPWGLLSPSLQGISRPGRGFVGVTGIAGVRDFFSFAGRRAHEAEGVAAYVHVSERLGNLGHVARDAFAAGAARLVVRMRFERWRMWTAR